MAPRKDRKGKSPPRSLEKWLEEIERNPRAFFDKTDAIDGQADELKTTAEDRKWSQAKWLHDQWNPHNEEPPGAPKTPRDGRTQAELVEETGRSATAVSAWIRLHRTYASPARTANGPAFSEAFAQISRRGDHEANRVSVMKSSARRALREQPERIAPEIAEALEQPEVAKAVRAAMKPKTLETFLPASNETEEPEQDAPDGDADAEGEVTRPKPVAVPDLPPEKPKDPFAKKGDRRLRNKLDRLGPKAHAGEDVSEYLAFVDLLGRDAAKAAAESEIEECLKRLLELLPLSGRLGKPKRDALAKQVTPIGALGIRISAMASEITERMVDDYDPSGKKPAKVQTLRREAS